MPWKQADQVLQHVTGLADKDDSDSKDGLILQESAPLPEPPEIAHVQRGLVSHFIGEFTNDGLESWSAIDLDRNTLTSVQRRVHDVRAKLSRPLSDPKFPTARHVGHSFARKFSSTTRTELEVVSTVRVDPPAMQAFICVANASWAAAAAKIPEISDGSQDTRLLDRESNGGRTTYFSKRVSFTGPLAFDIRSSRSLLVFRYQSAPGGDLPAYIGKVNHAWFLVMKRVRCLNVLATTSRGFTDGSSEAARNSVSTFPDMDLNAYSSDPCPADMLI